MNTVEKTWENKTFKAVIGFLGIIFSVFLWFYPTADDYETKIAVKMDIPEIELRFHKSIVLNPNFEYIFFYSTPIDSAYFLSSIPFVVTNRSTTYLDSLELGILLPKGARFETSPYTIDDVPNLVDRYYKEGIETYEVKYRIRNLSTDYSFLIDENIYLPRTNMFLHYIDGATYKNIDEINSSNIPYLNIDKVSKNGNTGEVSWDVIAYVSSPLIGTINYRLKFCRRKAKTEEDVMNQIKDYLMRLDKEKRKSTIAVFVNNDLNFEKDIIHSIKGDTISVPLFLDKLYPNKMKQIIYKNLHFEVIN